MPATTSLDERINVRIPGEQSQKLKELAEQEQVDVADIVRRALRQFISRNKRKPQTPTH